MAAYLVSEASLIRRVNRQLATEGRKLIKGIRARRGQHPPFYVIDVDTNTNVLLNVNLERYAREIGVLSIAEAMEK